MLTITAHLVAPLAVAEVTDISLDGILATAAFVAIGEVWPDPKVEWRWVPIPLVVRGPDAGCVADCVAGMPLTHAQQAALWWYAVSSPIPIDDQGQQAFHWTKRLPLDPYYADYLAPETKRKNVIITEKGRYRDYHDPLLTRSIQSIQWTADGDADAVQALLDAVRFIGKKRSQGYGQLHPDCPWAVTSDDMPYNDVQDGRYVRAVPMTRMTLDCPVAHMAFRAPQWLRCNQMVCHPPGSVA